MSRLVRESLSAVPSRVVQRECGDCAAKKTAAPCPTCGGRLVRPTESLLPPVQAKLHVNPANDVYEREADRVADSILSSAPPSGAVAQSAAAIQTKPAVRVTNLIQRQVDEDDESDAAEGGDDSDDSLQMDRGADAVATVSPEQEARVTALQGGGRPLSEEQRSFFEPRFGYGFGNVRIHNDGPASQSAGELGARAYTVGHDIVFGSGEYQPGADGGKHLLAHELTHVVQQNGGSQGAVQRNVLQRDEDPKAPPPVAESRCPSAPDAPASDAVKRVQVLSGDGLVIVEFLDGTQFNTRLDRAKTRIDKGTYTAIHSQGEANDCIKGFNKFAWHINKVPRAGGWSGIPSSQYQLVVSESSEAFEADPTDIGKKAKRGKDAGDADGQGAGKGQGSGSGAGKGPGDKGGTQAGGDKGAGQKAGDGKGGDKTGGTKGVEKSGGDKSGSGQTDSKGSTSTADDLKILNDFQKQLGEAGAETTVPPDLEIATALKDMTEAERADLARFLRESKKKAGEEGTAFDPKKLIEYYKNLSPADRELLRTNLELTKAGASKLPEKVQIALDTGAEQSGAKVTEQVKDLNAQLSERSKQLGELARINAKVTSQSKVTEKDLEPIDLNKLPVFTEMMLLEGLLAGASSKSPEIEAISKELMESIHGIRDFVLEEIAWLAAELALSSIFAALLAPVTAGLSAAAETAEAAYVIKRLNDLRKFLQKIEKIYNTIQKIRGVISKVIGVYATYKRIRAQYDTWSTRLERLQAMLEKASDGSDSIEEEIDKLEDEMIGELQKSLDDPQGLGGLLEQFFIPADTSEEELKEILFNIPKGIEAIREVIEFYGSVDRSNIEDIKTLAYKGVRAGVLLYPFVGFLAMLVGNELKALMTQPDLSERLLGIITSAADRASKRKLPTAKQNREKLKKVKKSKDKPKKKGDDKTKAKGKDKGTDKDKEKGKGKGKPDDKPKKDEDPAKSKKKGDDSGVKDDGKDPTKKQDDKDKKSADGQKKDDAKKPPDEDPKQKAKREEKEKSDAEWQLVLADVAKLKDAYATAGITQEGLRAEGRRIRQAHKDVAASPKVGRVPGKGYRTVSIARRGSKTEPPAKTDVLMNDNTRKREGRDAVEAKIKGLPADRSDKQSIEAELVPLKEAWQFKTLRVGHRNDGRQGDAVYGAMGTAAEVVIITMDDITNMHFGTQGDPIPVHWYKQLSNYPASINLTINGTSKAYPMNSPEQLTIKTTRREVKVWVGIDMNNLVAVDTVMQRHSTPRLGDKQQDYRDALEAAGFRWGKNGTPGSKDADHVRDLAFSGADDFDNLWPLDSDVNRWAYTGRWYRDYNVEYRDQKNLRQANVGSLYTLRDKYFKVVGFKTTPPPLGGKTDKWKSPDKP